MQTENYLRSGRFVCKAASASFASISFIVLRIGACGMRPSCCTESLDSLSINKGARICARKSARRDAIAHSKARVQELAATRQGEHVSIATFDTLSRMHSPCYSDLFQPCPLSA